MQKAEYIKLNELGSDDDDDDLQRTECLQGPSWASKGSITTAAAVIKDMKGMVSLQDMDDEVAKHEKETAYNYLSEKGVTHLSIKELALLYEALEQAYNQPQQSPLNGITFERHFPFNIGTSFGATTTFKKMSDLVAKKLVQRTLKKFEAIEGGKTRNIDPTDLNDTQLINTLYRACNTNHSRFGHFFDYGTSPAKELAHKLCVAGLDSKAKQQARNIFFPGLKQR